MPQFIPPVEILRAGTFADMSGVTHTFSQSDLQQIADAYDPLTAPAPLVIGHPELDAPAYGWVERLEVRGDRLMASSTDVVPEFAEALKARRYRGRSASLYVPGQHGNPKPDGYYLRHVGFLGAAAPGVPGLADVHFAAGAAGCASFALAGTTPSRTNMSEQELAAKAAEIAAREQELASRAAAIAAQEHALKRQECAQFAAGLVEARRLLPKHQAAVVTLLLSVPETTADFAAPEGSAAPSTQALLRELLTSLPAAQGPAIGVQHAPAAAGAAGVQFAAPPGAHVNTDRLALLAQARALMAAQQITLADAVRQLGG